MVCEESLVGLLEGLQVVTVPALTAAEGLPLALELWRAKSFTDPAAADASYLRRTEEEMLERQAAHRERKGEAARLPGAGQK